MILKRWVEIFEINFVSILRDERRVSARRRFFFERVQWDYLYRLLIIYIDGLYT